MRPTADTWVMRNKVGDLEQIRVTDMSDAHLYRWVHYWRKRYNEIAQRNGTSNDAHVTDATIRDNIVTAKAIYREINRRNINLKGPCPSENLAAPVYLRAFRSVEDIEKARTVEQAPPSVPEMLKPGVRCIVFEEDE